MDDGRFHKVANVIGNTMKFHPHGDASIGDAMVQIENKKTSYLTARVTGVTFLLETERLLHVTLR